MKKYNFIIATAVLSLANTCFGQDIPQRKNNKNWTAKKDFSRIVSGIELVAPSEKLCFARCRLNPDIQ